MEPGLIQIRPLRISEIVAAAMKSLIKNPAATWSIGLYFATFLGLTTLASRLVMGPNQQLTERLNELSTSTMATGPDLSLVISELRPTFLMLTALTILVYFSQNLVIGILTPVIGYLVTGTKISRTEAWIRVRPMFSRLLMLSAVILAIQIAAFIAPVFLAVLISNVFPATVGSFIISFSLIVAVGLLIFTWTSLLLAPSALVFEEISIKLSLLRSRELVKKNFARILFGTVWATILAQAIGLLGQIPFALISQAASNGGEISTFSVFADTMGTIIGYSLILPFIAAFLILLYIDQRIRHENLSQNLKSVMGQ